jgi:hypothetical protein
MNELKLSNNTLTVAEEFGIEMNQLRNIENKEYQNH